MSALVELREVSKRFGVAGAETEVLRGVDLSVAEGESVAVVGPSGSGKSTLLHLIGALAPPTGGSVRIAGADLADLDADALADLRSETVGFVFQEHHLLPQCSALENVLVPTLARKGGDRSRALDRARALLDAVGLADRADHRPGELSGGERQRVAVVRALVNEPRLLLADEPTGSLDAEAAAELGELLTRLHGEHGLTLVVVTHAEALAALMQRRLALAAGRLVDR
ncbi:MAG: ABC transporter ATP-binding protein [Planctomycetota bacterium]|nr:ABC transporter ATP-binding protein [Planctomycetota bacterium]MDP6763258.1 ABC transporter ATP-binding protein [Planctomycetota bacterium]MDP6990048.1 ABC transporter ATP-binding protein [Planctomycetota bacterium]